MELPILDGQSVKATHLPAILDVQAPELQEWLQQHAQPPLRARQIQRWLLVGGAESFAEMTDLPLQLRQHLTQDFAVLATRVVRHLRASDDTHKLLLALADGNTVECVLIQEGGRRTACISTQVGCGMGCVFCASGLAGVDRNLTTGEILEQLLRLRNLPAAGQATRVPGPPARLTHIVVMGMGEPLANLDSLLAALNVATSARGLGLSARHVTISTVGLPVKIRRLAELDLHYHLAVSLHAPNDALRTRIVPTNDKTGITEIVAAADYYFARTGRQVTYEYVLLGGLNDQPVHARELLRLLRGRRAHVNLIPFNEVNGLDYRRPDEESLESFVQTLRAGGLSVKVRKRKGSEIDAACGQLRRETEQGRDVILQTNQ